MNLGRPKQEAPPEPKQLFLRVLASETRLELWPWGDGKYGIHDPGDGRLVITRRDRREHAAVYAAGGWLKYDWVVAKPSAVAHRRADTWQP